MYHMFTRQAQQAYNKSTIQYKEVRIMCIAKKELNEKMAEIQSLKKLKEETEDTIKALEREVIEFLEENEEECKTTNDKGKEILKFIGNLFTATLAEQSRETIDKEKVKKLLDDEEYQKVRKVSTFPVLCIK